MFSELLDKAEFFVQSFLDWFGSLGFKDWPGLAFEFIAGLSVEQWAIGSGVLAPTFFILFYRRIAEQSGSSNDVVNFGEKSRRATPILFYTLILLLPIGLWFLFTERESLPWVQEAIGALPDEVVGVIDELPIESVESASQAIEKAVETVVAVPVVEKASGYVEELSESLAEATTPAKEEVAQSVAELPVIQVGRIVDGDTVAARIDGRIIRIRLDLIDTPESRQPYGRQATIALKDILRGKTIRLQNNGVDRYGRTLGVLYLANGENINLALVQAGAAWCYRKYLSFRERRACVPLEKTAKKEKLGLWAAPDPIAPWRWRTGDFRKS